MEPLVVATFALVLALAAASPGPAVAALIARVVARGPRGASWFVAGLALGDVIWFLCAAFGLAAVASAFQPVFEIVRYAGAAYLLWMAYKLWSAPAMAVADSPVGGGEGPRALAGALALQLGNPKTMLFYLALLPTLVPLERLSMVIAAEFAGVTFVVSAAVMAAYVVVALRVRRAFRSPRAVRTVNRLSGTMMGAAAGVVVAQG